MCSGVVLDGASSADPTTGPADKPDPPKKVDEQDPDVIKRRINLLTRRMASYVDEQIAAGDGDTLADAEMDLLETMDIYFHRCSCFKIKLKIKNQIKHEKNKRQRHQLIRYKEKTEQWCSTEFRSLNLFELIT